MLSLSLSDLQPVTIEYLNQIMYRGFSLADYTVVFSSNSQINPLELDVNRFIVLLNNAGYFVHRQQPRIFTEDDLKNLPIMPEKAILSSTQNIFLSKICLAARKKDEFEQLPLGLQRLFFDKQAYVHPKGSAPAHLDELLRTLVPNCLFSVGVLPEFSVYGRITRTETLYN